MITSTEFFEPWEQELSSLDAFLEVLRSPAFETFPDDGRVFAWRGVVDAEWALYSSLYRRLRWTNPLHTTEKNLNDREAALLADAHRWGLHYSGRSHLPILYELATLQHFNAPTRLLDVSFSPLVSLWFAVEDQRDDSGQPSSDIKDGRLFVFDVSGQMINESPKQRRWEETFQRPWSGRTKPPDWSQRIWCWRPAPTEPRFAAQHGGFIFGGVPATGGVTWPKRPSGSAAWRIEDVRACTSVAVRFHQLNATAGRPAKNAAYTFRIPSYAKADIREDLRRYFDLEPRTIYPDHIGFASFGQPDLARRPHPVRGPIGGP